MPPTQGTPEVEKSEGNLGMKLAVGAVVIAGVAGAGYYLSQNSKETAETTSPIPPTTTTDTVVTEESPSTTTVGTLYKDGTYTAVGTYSSPAGKETVSVNLSLKGDVVTDATFTGTATNRESKFYQKQFADGFKALVVGKSIDTLSLDAVNGSSLTPRGFMEAVAKIKAEAKA